MNVLEPAPWVHISLVICQLERQMIEAMRYLGLTPVYRTVDSSDGEHGTRQPHLTHTRRDG